MGAAPGIAAGQDGRAPRGRWWARSASPTATPVDPGGPGGRRGMEPGLVDRRRRPLVRAGTRGSGPPGPARGCAGGRRPSTHPGGRRRPPGLRHPLATGVGDEWVVVEVENRTPVPFAVALVIRPFVADGPSARSARSPSSPSRGQRPRRRPPRPRRRSAGRGAAPPPRARWRWATEPRATWSRSSPRTKPERTSSRRRAPTAWPRSPSGVPHPAHGGAARAGAGRGPRPCRGHEVPGRRTRCRHRGRRLGDPPTRAPLRAARTPPPAGGRAGADPGPAGARWRDRPA
jgi:hypothetical protein